MRKEKEYTVSVIIPCYNEAKTIGKVICDFKKELPQSTIYICDNNSTDNTNEVAGKNGAIVLSERRQGKTYSVLKLFKTIDSDITVMVDGDDTYPSDTVKEMINLFLSNDIDMLVGDRITNGAYKEQNNRKGHYFGNNLVRGIINRLFKSNLKDVLSGYRIFSKRYVKNYSTLVKGFELETDLSVFALNYDLGYAEIPINYQKRPADSYSKLNTYKDGISILKTIVSLYRFYRPLSFFSSFSIMSLILSLLVGSFPIIEFIKFNYVYKVPLAILAGILASISLLLLVCGLILDTIMKIDKKNITLKIRNN